METVREPIIDQPTLFEDPATSERRFEWQLAEQRMAERIGDERARAVAALLMANEGDVLAAGLELAPVEDFIKQLR